MLCRVVLVRTDALEEYSAFFIKEKRIGKLKTTLAVTSIFLSSPIIVTLITEALRSSETSFLTRATWRNIPEDAILQVDTCFQCGNKLWASMKCWETIELLHD
jgi:hypothetical protein